MGWGSGEVQFGSKNPRVGSRGVGGDGNGGLRARYVQGVRSPGADQPSGHVRSQLNSSSPPKKKFEKMV